MKTKVVNIHDKNARPYTYIGRPADGRKTHFGNPFRLREYCRYDSVWNFYEWLADGAFEDLEPERRQWILDNLETLRGKRLGCFCVPKMCHGHAYLVLLGEISVDDLDEMFDVNGEPV